MRILFLSHYFPPEVNAPASRTYEHCKQWVRDGHDVTVVTCNPNHPKGEVYPGYSNKLIQKEQKDGIRLVRVWTYVTANEGLVKRTINYFSFMMATIVFLPFVSKADVVVTTSPQFFNGLAGYFVSRFRGIPWVFEVRDLWPESILAVGAVRNRMVIRTLEALEGFAYRKAERIVPVTDAFRQYMIDKGVQESKIEVIKNGVDLAFYDCTQADSILTRELGVSGKFVASYFGTHGMAHHLETLLEAAWQLRDHPEIVFVMVGDGAERERLLAIRDEKRLTNVVMVGQQPKERMPAFWALSSVSLVLLSNTPLFRTVIPSKIFESMAMERPIVLGVEGESAGIIQEAGAGFCIEPEDATALAGRILELSRDKQLRASMGARGRRCVEENFDRTVQARKFEALLRDVTGTGRQCVAVK